MTELPEVKLIAAYDRSANEYSVVAHNQTNEEAERYREQWSRHLRPECSFVVLRQTAPHKTEKAEQCRACRNTVARSGEVNPNAKFTRRHA